MLESDTYNSTILEEQDPNDERKKRRDGKEGQLPSSPTPAPLPALCVCISALGCSQKTSGWSPMSRPTAPEYQTLLIPQMALLEYLWDVTHLSGLLTQIYTTPILTPLGLCLLHPSHLETAYTPQTLPFLRVQLSPTFFRKPLPTLPTCQSHPGWATLRSYSLH